MVTELRAHFPGDHPDWPTLLPIHPETTEVKVYHRCGITFVFVRDHAGVPFETMYQRPSTRAELREREARFSMIPKYEFTRPR